MERVLAVNLFRMTLMDTCPCEEEINILGATLLESPRGPLRNRCYARGEESLREPARLPGRVWEDKRYAGSTAGPVAYEKKKKQASREEREG